LPKLWKQFIAFGDISLQELPYQRTRYMIERKIRGDEGRRVLKVN
jgi:hypothetical protein